MTDTKDGCASSTEQHHDPEYSPLARRVPGVRDPKLALHREAWGVTLHTTGSGVTARAHEHKCTPLEWAIRYYVASQNGANGYKWGGPAYVIDYDGTPHQLAPDNAKTAHCGGRSPKYPSGTRHLYIEGEWTKLASADAVKAWREKWPGRAHCYSLFPSADPNRDYIGIEMIPISNGFGGEPMAPGLRFTKAQHDGAADLVRDIGKRHGWPAGWHRTARLVGHEDVDLLNRCDSHGGWDPGWTRQGAPFFDFAYVRGRIG